MSASYDTVTSGKRPILLRWAGTWTAKAMVSPMASWNPNIHLELVKRNFWEKIIQYLEPTWVGSIPELEWLVLVLDKVLDVSHLMVNSHQVLKVSLSAHLDPV